MDNEQHSAFLELLMRRDTAGQISCDDHLSALAGGLQIPR